MVPLVLHEEIESCILIAKINFNRTSSGQVAGYFHSVQPDIVFEQLPASITQLSVVSFELQALDTLFQS